MLVPELFSLITQNDDFLLDSQQKTPLLFKFLSFRDVNIVQKKKDKYSLYERKIHVMIMDSHNVSRCSMQVIIKPRPQHIDHYFNYWEASNSKKVIEFPNFLPYNLIRPGLTSKVSHPLINSQISEEDGMVCLSLTTPEEDQ